jgi:branched-chain amino acid transport system permease protein
MEYILHLLIMIAIYTILVVSLDLIAGYTGLLSIAHAAFYGIGAYVTALLSIHFRTQLPLNVMASAIVAAFLGVIFAVPLLRLRDDYFVVATLGFQMILYNIFNNWVGLTGGPLGLPGIPKAILLGTRIDTSPKFLIVAAGLALMVYFVVRRLVRSPYGRVLKAIREDERFAQALGKNVRWYKVQVFVVGSALAAIAGCLYAHYTTFIDPTSFTVRESILITSMVILGGAGSLRGPILGAVMLTVFPELLRFIGFQSSVAANLRQVLYGSLLVLAMLYRPHGLMGEFGFEK